jgi:electron transport complex, RnfABCDGE type, D subunit
MQRVLYALVPGIFATAWYFGSGVLFNILIACVSALACEAAMLALRGKPLSMFLTDGSALVTAVLLALTLPSLTLWWFPAIGSAFAIVLAKHLYGGLGYNLFNPAMVGYVILLISFPREMSTHLPPAMLAEQGLSFWQTALYTFTGELPGHLSLDAITMAPPLDTVKTQFGLIKTLSEIRASPLFGDFGSRGWTWIAIWFFLGGVWLIYMRVISWHIPTAMLGSLILVALVFHLVDPDRHLSPLFHIFSGSAILSAFFIATDPVTAATTHRGQLIYGASVGLLTYIIRTWGGYPDGVAFAVLLLNMAAPTIDYYTQPRIFGARKD